MDAKQMQNLVYEVALVVFEAGKLAMEFYGLEDFELKEDKSPLTKADLALNALITQRLNSLSPYLICSEEAILDYQDRANLEYYWLVDPLDGTKDFLAKNGGFTINIALIERDRPVLGVVGAPFFDTLYFAFKGLGAFVVHGLTNPSIQGLKEQQILLNGDRQTTNPKLVACDSVFHSTQETQDFLAKYDLDVLKRGSSLKICALAEGVADLYPRFNGTKEWDIAASDIILQEAGGVVLDLLTKQPLAYNKKEIKNNHFIAFSKGQKQGVIYNCVCGENNE